MDFSQLSLLLVIASLFGIFARTFKQPLLVGYLFAGILLAAMGIVTESARLENLGKIGVTFLLFLLGIEMNLKELPTIGKVAAVTGIGQIVITFIFGALLALGLGIKLPAAAYIGIALTFSSTVIIVKLLSEKKELASLYGKISVGFLLIQDLVAIVILIFLSSLGKGNFQTGQYALIALKILGLFAGVWILSKKILPYVFDRIISSSLELLFIVSIAWALGVATFVAGPVGFTLEIGGFLAGLSLSNLPEHLQIASRTRPLRDFFLTIFFLYIGTKLYVGGEIFALLPEAGVFSIFVLVGNPIIVLIIMGLLGYKKRTSFLAGLTVAQISEFSFILMEVGESSGHVTKSQVSLVILTGVITMTVSTYLIIWSEKIYKVIGKYLSIFEKKRSREITLNYDMKPDNHTVLIGADRAGRNLCDYFKSRLTPFLVIDFNPSIIAKLTAENIPAVFGDITDPEIIEITNLDKSKTVISTIPSVDDNLSILEFVRPLKIKPLLIMTAQTRRDGIKLYEAGATYVVIPELVAGEHIRQVIDLYDANAEKLTQSGKRHFDRLIFT